MSCDHGHLAGPWCVANEAKYHGLNFLRIVDAAGKSVAYVFSNQGAELTPQQRATADLVACTPELLAPLQFFAAIEPDQVNKMLEVLPETERFTAGLAFRMARDANAKAMNCPCEVSRIAHP